MVAWSGKRTPSGFCRQRDLRGLPHQVFIPSEEDSVKHGLVKEEVAHPLRSEIFPMSKLPHTSEMMISTLFTGNSTSSSLPLTNLISPISTSHRRHPLSSVNPFARTIFSAWSRMLDMSIPMTKSAPAFEANMESIPVPHPTSNQLSF